MTAVDDAQVEHDLRCPEFTAPGFEPDPTRCTCRDAQGHTPAESWADGPLAAFDLETSGKDPLTARIVTATLIRIRPGQPAETINWLSDCAGFDIPDEVAAIHGVTTAHAREHGQPHDHVVSEIRRELELGWVEQAPVVGHNVSYDLTVMQEECVRAGQQRTFRVAGPVIDTIVLDRGVDKYRRGSRKLIDTARHYGVRLTEAEAHGSEADALAAARIAYKIARRYPVIGTMPLAALQRWQADRHRAWANGFGAYLRDQGKTDDVCREWPLRSTT